MLNSIREKFTYAECVYEEEFDHLAECCNYGSMGTMTAVVKDLKILNGRIIHGERLQYKHDGLTDVLDSQKFRSIVECKFPDYVTNQVVNIKSDSKESYFELSNTSKGFRMVFYGETPSDLIVHVADIDKTYAIVRLAFNNVIYIKNKKTGDITPMVSEHNNHYVYDHDSCEILEIFN